MKYRICQRCGAHLDYGERCDCEEQEKQRESDEKSLFSETSGPSRTFYRLDREKPENRVKYGALPKSEAPRIP